MRWFDRCRTLGVAILAFGCGVLLSFFLPQNVLIIIEAAVIIGIGALCLARR